MIRLYHVMRAAATTSPGRHRARAWLLLIHQLPVDPAYLRVKVARRLRRLGAVQLKSSVYVLPASDETVRIPLADPRDRRRRRRATLARTSFLDGSTTTRGSHVPALARRHTTRSPHRPGLEAAREPGGARCAPPNDAAARTFGPP